jgi:hypothetical protein
MKSKIRNKKYKCDGLLPSAAHDAKTPATLTDAKNLFFLRFKILVSDNASVVLIS